MTKKFDSQHTNMNLLVHDLPVEVPIHTSALLYPSVQPKGTPLSNPKQPPLYSFIKAELMLPHSLLHGVYICKHTSFSVSLTLLGPLMSDWFSKAASFACCIGVSNNNFNNT